MPAVQTSMDANDFDAHCFLEQLLVSSLRLQDVTYVPVTRQDPSRTVSPAVTSSVISVSGQISDHFGRHLDEVVAALLQSGRCDQYVQCLCDELFSGDGFGWGLFRAFLALVTQLAARAFLAGMLFLADDLVLAGSRAVELALAGQVRRHRGWRAFEQDSVKSVLKMAQRQMADRQRALSKVLDDHQRVMTRLERIIDSPDSPWSLSSGDDGYAGHCRGADLQEMDFMFAKSLMECGSSGAAINEGVENHASRFSRCFKPGRDSKQSHQAACKDPIYSASERGNVEEEIDKASLQAFNSTLARCDDTDQGIAMQIIQATPSSGSSSHLQDASSGSSSSRVNDDLDDLKPKTQASRLAHVTPAPQSGCTSSQEDETFQNQSLRLPPSNEVDPHCSLPASSASLDECNSGKSEGLSKSSSGEHASPSRCDPQTSSLEPKAPAESHRGIFHDYDLIWQVMHVSARALDSISLGVGV